MPHHPNPAGAAGRPVRRHRPPALVGWWVLLLPLPAALAQTPATLVNAGDWSDPAIWSTNPVVPNNGQPSPDSLYDVTITNRSVDLDVDVTVSDLTLGHSSGATNVLTNDTGVTRRLTVEDVFNYRQGIVSGDVEVKINPTGTMNFQSTPSGQTKQWNATLLNEGEIVIDFLTNLQSTGPSSQVINGPGGIVQINNTTTFSQTAGSVDPIFRNQAGGEVNINGVATTTINWLFENSGTVNVNGGSLTANQGGMHDGTFDVAANRRVTFGGAGTTHTLLPDSVVTGPGTAAFSTDAAVQSSPDNFDIANLAINTGDVMFEHAGPGDFNFDSVDLNGGRLFFDEDAGGINTGSLFWRGGDIDADLTVTGILSGTATTNPSEPRMITGTLTNQGLVNVAGTIDTDAAEGGGKLVNEGTIKTTGTTTISGDGTFVNDGQLQVAPGTTTNIDVELETTADSVLEVTEGAALFVAKARILNGVLIVGDEGFTKVLLSDQETFTGLFTLQLGLGAAMTVATDKDIQAGRADVFSDLGGNGRFSIDGRFEAFNSTSPGKSPGTFTIDAPQMVMGDTHRLNMEFGAPGSADVDLLVINADELTLDGTVNVTALAGFAAGTYVLIEYSGALIDLGMEIGAFPAGFDGEIVIDPLSQTVLLEVTAIPEAAALAGLALAAGGVAAARRRRSPAAWPADRAGAQ